MCFSSRISEREAVDLAVLGLVKPLKDVAFQLEFSSLAHLIQKLTSYEQYHPELYLDKFQDKFKRAVNIVEMDGSEEDDDEYGQEVAVAKWARGQTPWPTNG